MGTEIERKFLVQGDAWRTDVIETHQIEQGYMRSPDTTLRVRTYGEDGYYTIKGRTVGVTRSEWEWQIPLQDARDLLDEYCEGRRLSKTRYVLEVADHEWVVDEFHDELEGLLLAEVELDSEDEEFVRPGWAYREVSDDPRFFNVNLIGESFDDFEL